MGAENITAAKVDIADIPSRLARLREKGMFQPVFGATSHRFQLNPPLVEAEIAAFEQSHHAKLPADYRQFLLQVGNGGAGPFYGIHKLGFGNDEHPFEELDWHLGDLSHPFPHTAAWNPAPEERDHTHQHLSPAELEYLNPKHVSGAIPICDYGSGIEWWLVITGPEAGHIWFDDRVDWHGLSPAADDQHSRLTFSQWYGAWLAEVEQLLL